MQCGHRNHIFLYYRRFSLLCLLPRTYSKLISDWNKSHSTWTLYISLICVTGPSCPPTARRCWDKDIMAMGLCTLKVKLTLRKSLRTAGEKTTQRTLNTVWSHFYTLHRNVFFFFTVGGFRQDCACELEPHAFFSGFSLEGGMLEKGCTSADLAGRSWKWTFKHYILSGSYSRSHSKTWPQKALFKKYIAAEKLSFRKQQVHLSSLPNFGSLSYLLIHPV